MRRARRVGRSPPARGPPRATSSRGVLATPVSPELIPPGDRRHHRAADRGHRRPLRAPRLLPLGLPPPGRGAAQDPLPRLPRLRRPLRPRDALKRWLRVFIERFFEQPVQALGPARWAQGGLRQPLPAGRLAHAERRVEGGVASGARPARTRVPVYNARPYGVAAARTGPPGPAPSQLHRKCRSKRFKSPISSFLRRWSGCATSRTTSGGAGLPRPLVCSRGSTPTIGAATTIPSSS